MIRIAVCDDSDLQLDIMRDILAEYAESVPNVEANFFPGGRELIADVRDRGAYDIYILDMIMPSVNGMEVATTLRLIGDTGRIIFLTASLEYSDAASNVNAFYYMTKPLDRNKLFRVLDRAVSLIISSTDAIELKSKAGLVTVSYDDVIYIDLENRALRYHLRDGRIICGNVIRIPFRDTVASFLERPRFSLCGVSMVVNLDCIDRIEGETILFSDGSIAYPSKTGLNQIKAAWLQKKIK